MVTQTPYEVLGVKRDASADDIRKAYRKLAKKHHPDQNPNDSKAKDRFAAANQAYEIVGDEKNRQAFDRGEIDAEGKQRFQGFEGAPGGDPFAGFRRQQAGPGGQRFEFRSGGDPFGGDAGAMVLGALLMATFYVPIDTGSARPTSGVSSGAQHSLARSARSLPPDAGRPASPGAGHYLQTTWLRWGFLVLGALAVTLALLLLLTRLYDRSP